MKNIKPRLVLLSLSGIWSLGAYLTSLGYLSCSYRTRREYRMVLCRAGDSFNIYAYHNRHHSRPMDPGSANAFHKPWPGRNVHARRMGLRSKRHAGAIRPSFHNVYTVSSILYADNRIVQFCGVQYTWPGQALIL